jgi:uncharacterized membrane protein YkvA (DUF1232 family)
MHPRPPSLSLFERAKSWARAMKREVYAVAIALGDRQTPWYARALGWLVVAYAFSPVDLIPDFVPVLGYLDDLLLVPLGIWLVVRLIPEPVLQRARSRVDENAAKPTSWAGAALIATLWAAVLGAVGFLIWHWS